MATRRGRIGTRLAILAAVFAWCRPSFAADPQVLRLIDGLTRVDSQGVGFHATAWASGFLGVDSEPEFRGGIIGSARPVADPTMQALVRKGVAAVPDLLEHLTDRRETRVKVGGFMAMWFDEEYDPREPAPPSREPAPARLKHVRGYTLRVGDLCFVALGQIVNRQLNAIRYQPSLCLVINSPIETPKLAELARKDWAGLTPESHRRSLIREARSPHFDPGALVRLRF